ncbi:MAG: hypothetical protein RSB94_08060 [Erysipelotrichaceae bacterium]
MQIYIEQPSKDVERTYPYIGTNLGFTVYFIAPKTGIDLDAKDEDDTFYSNDWNENLFEPLPKGSKVIIEV